MDDRPLLLEHAYRWERTSPSQIWLTQPMGGGRVRTYTWAEALDEARRMARYLQSQGFEPGSRIAMLSKNCAEFVIAELAIWMAGHVSVALYPTLVAETVRYILEHSDARLIFVGKLDDWPRMSPGVPDDLPRVAFTLAPDTNYKNWADIIAHSDPIEGSPTRRANELATILYTSGSTGTSKGVMHSFASMMGSADASAAHIPMAPEDRVLSYLPLAHAMERSLVECLSLRTGIQVFFTESLDTFIEDLARARPTVFASVPRLWLKFQQGVYQSIPPKRLQRLLGIPVVRGITKKKVLATLGLDQTRVALSGSAPIPPELIQWYRDLGLELLEGYGMTENFACASASAPGSGRAGCVGRPLPGVEIRISEEGEILIKSPGAMMGYFKEPEMTAECFTEDGFFRTGDRGECDSEGRLKITGRVKELFKTSKGKYVSPAPIENLLNNDLNVELSCVSGSGQPQPYAIIAPAEELRRDLDKPPVRRRVADQLERLLSEVNQKVETFEQLQFLVVAKEPWAIENGLLTPTMKIKRARIEEQYGPMCGFWYAEGKRVIWEDSSTARRPDLLGKNRAPSRDERVQP